MNPNLNTPPTQQPNFNQPNSKLGFLTFLKWAIGLFFIGRAIFFLSSSELIAGICLFASGLLLLPPAQQWIEQLIKVTLSRSIKYITVVSLFLIAVIAGHTTNKAGTAATDEAVSSTNTDSTAAASDNATANTYQSYLDKCRAIAAPNPNQQASRERAVHDLESNSTYQQLVVDKVLDQKYLFVLQALGEAVLSYDGKNFSIPETTEEKLKQMPGGREFLVSSMILHCNGGLTPEILNVYQRYAALYRVSGLKGSLIYHADSGDNETLSHTFTLAPMLTVAEPDNKAMLDEYYTAISEGIISWHGSRSFAPYYYLQNKRAFNIYLGQHYPESPNYTHIDLYVSAAQLYADYDANEVAADEKYKGKSLAVTGTIGRIAKNFLNEPYITLRTGEFGDVQCSFEKAEVLKQLNRGDKITVIGECTGKMSILILLKDSKML